MKKHFLIVVHGIGEHTSDSVTNEVVTALTKVHPQFSDEVETRALTYNYIFQDWLDSAKEDWQAAISSLSSVNHFTGVKNLLSDLVNTDESNFNQTHLFDAVLYLSKLGVRVQLEVALQLADVLDEFLEGGNTSNRRIVLMGHSMGTAVLHDTLHKMFVGGFEKDRLNRLSEMPFTFDALYQVANTSRLFKTMVDPTSMDTSVRPVPTGMIDKMYNVLHTLDPVPHLKRFEVNTDTWLPETFWPAAVYKEIELKSVTSKEIHSLDHYLSDPRLHIPLLGKLLDNYDPGDSKEIIKKYDHKVRNQIKKKFQNSLKVNIKNAKSRVTDSTESIIEALEEALKDI